MLGKTKGIVLRSVKYGETSLILSVFTEVAGLRSYMIKGIRSEKAKSKRAGLLQVASFVEIISEHKANRQLQHIKEFQPAYIYQSLHEEIIKNSIAIFSVELLTRLLPQEEIMEDLFHFTSSYFLALDESPLKDAGNFPLFFIIQCGKYFGYNILGSYSAETPYLNAAEGIFTGHVPETGSTLNEYDIRSLAELMTIKDIEKAGTVPMNAAIRNRLLDWYIAFLQHHTQHLGNLRSLEILRTILH